jgi:hypothetical protein
MFELLFDRFYQIKRATVLHFVQERVALQSKIIGLVEHQIASLFSVSIVQMSDLYQSTL